MGKNTYSHAHLPCCVGLQWLMMVLFSSHDLILFQLKIHFLISCLTGLTWNYVFNPGSYFTDFLAYKHISILLNLHGGNFVHFDDPQKIWEHCLHFLFVSISICVVCNASIKLFPGNLTPPWRRSNGDSRCTVLRMYCKRTLCSYLNFNLWYSECSLLSPLLCLKTFNYRFIYSHYFYT